MMKFHSGGVAQTPILRNGEIAAILTPAAVSKYGDGWCGEPCPECKGNQFDEDGRSCGRCGGTGERYESSLDLRDHG